MRKIPVGIQELLVTALCFDASPRGAKAVAALVPAKWYDQFYRDVAEEAEQYLTRYGKPPGEHTLEIIESIKLARPDDADAFDRVYSGIIRNWDQGLNLEFIHARAGLFVRAQNAKASIQKALPLLQKATSDSSFARAEEALAEAEGLLMQVGKRGVDLMSPGTVLNDPEQALRFLDTAEDDVFPMGVKEMDDQHLGPVRSGLWLGVAPPGTGKTWLAVHLGKTALQHGKCVLHVTLEMSEGKICQRYLQSIFSIGKRDAKAHLAREFEKDEMGRFAALKEYKIKGRKSMESDGIREHLVRKMRVLEKRPRLIVKQFPTGQLTMRGLSAYLDQLAGAISFTPDLLIVDYADLMHLDTKRLSRREALGQTYIDLRGIAVERNLAGVTFSQSNKLGMSSRIIDMRHLAEDFSKGATVDTVVTYNQTDVEYELGLARLFVAKAREEKKHFQVLLTQSYALGQFCMDSCLMSSSLYWPVVEADQDADAEADDE